MTSTDTRRSRPLEWTRRLRRTGYALAVGASGLAWAGSAAAQEPAFTSRPLSAGHWTATFHELLYAAGVSAAWAVWAEPVPAGPQALVFRTAAGELGALGAVSSAWSERLDAEGALSAGQWGRFQVGGGFEASDVSVVPERGGFLTALGDIPLAGSVAVWAEGELSSEGSGAELLTGGVAVRFGAGELLAGRVRSRIGQGTSRILLSGNQSMDGVGIGTARPFVLPGFLEALGRTTAHVFVSPNIDTPTTERAWFTSMGFSVEPHPAVTFGFYRTVRFGGEGLSEGTPAEIWKVFSGQGGQQGFDDNQGELALRLRFRAWGQPVSPYVSLGFEDPPSIYEDPGVVAGLLVPIGVGRGVLAARYEYQAFGRSARWCGSCEYRSHKWYNEESYGSYALDGAPLGSSLGGYGKRHLVEVTWWGIGPLRLAGLLFHENREEGNLLFDRWPGSRRGIGGSVVYRPRPGWEIEVGAVAARAEETTDGGASLTLRVFDVLANPAGTAR